MSSSGAAYRVVETALDEHLATCAVCAAGPCPDGFGLLGVEVREWAAYVAADPAGAAVYDAARTAALTARSAA